MAMPTLPFESMMKAVEVAEAVEVEMVNNGEVFEERPAIESFAQGEVVPMPTRPLDFTTIVAPAWEVQSIDPPKATSPAEVI